MFGIARGGLLRGELPIGQVDGKDRPEPGRPLAQRANRVEIERPTPWLLSRCPEDDDGQKSKR
jgi:hypothetical protein